MNTCNCGAGGCWHCWLPFVDRMLIGSFFLVNGLYQVFGFFGGPGLVESINILRASDISYWVSSLVVVGGLIGGCFLLLGFLAELGALLVLPWWLLFVYFKGQVDCFFSVHLLSVAPMWTLMINVLILLLVPLLPIVLMYRGPGKFALWHPCKKLHGYFFNRKCCR